MQYPIAIEPGVHSKLRPVQRLYTERTISSLNNDSVGGRLSHRRTDQIPIQVIHGNDCWPKRTLREMFRSAKADLQATALNA